MIKVKDGYAKLIGTTYSGSISRVLLSNGGDHILGNSNGNIPLNNGTVNTNLNADMLDGLHIHAGRNNEVNKIVRTDASGHILAGWINTTSSDIGTDAINKIYCSNDDYIRYKTPANFFPTLANIGNDISITVAGLNRTLTVAYASNADTIDGYHANKIYNVPSFTVANSNTSNTYILLATITIGGTSLDSAEFTILFQNRECLDKSSFILSGAIRRNSTTSIDALLSYITLHIETPRNIYLRSDDGVTFMVYIQSATNIYTTYYRAIPIVDSGNITYSNIRTTSPISGSVLNITATKGGNVNYASSASDAEHIVSNSTSKAKSLTYYIATKVSETLADGNSWCKPTGVGLDGNSMILRMSWFNPKYGHDIFASPNTLTLWHRSTSNNTATWREFLDSINYTTYTVKKDGTGATGTWGINITGNAATASKLGTSTIGATNIPIYLNGGTPTVVNLNSTANNLINNLPIGDTIPFDKDYYIAQYANGDTTKIQYYRKPHFLLYNYIKNKAEGTWNISAAKIGTLTIGSTIMPVYINKGTPTVITSFPEAYLSWGGKNFSSGYGPIDAAIIPNLGANRLAFMPASGIEIQYSTDNGSTWLTYSTNDYNKINLFNGNGSSYVIGASSATGINKSQYQLRIIITTNIARVYTKLNKFCIYCSTNGSSGCWCTIDAMTKANVDNGTNTWQIFADKVSISGWSGYNIINISSLTTYGNSSSLYQKIRFTFGVTSHPSSSTYMGLNISSIMGFGGVGWMTPSTMATNGRMYTYDANKNVTFPAKVISGGFSGNLEGNATTATTLQTARTLTIGNTGKSFNGSSNVSWSLSEIGAASSGHTHTTSIATSTDTNQITLVYGGKYKLTAGGTSYVFTIPTSDNTWRPIGTGATDAAAGNHIHKNLIIKWGTGDTEGTNLFTYNGGTAKTINLSTPFSLLFTNFSNIGSLTTSISIGGITKTLKIDADTVDGYHADSFYRYRGSYGKSYTDESTEYNLSTGTYVTSEKGHSGTLLSFSSSSSASALQFWTHYNQGNLYYRTSVDNNKWSKTNGAWTRILDSDNYNIYTVKKDGTGASGTWGINITGNAATASKLGTSTIGATNIPIYLNSGTPTTVNLNSTANNLINNLTTETSTPMDADYYISQYVNGGTTTTTFHRRPHSALYNYIKNKASGTWNISISGNAATASKATTADTAGALYSVTKTDPGSACSDGQNVKWFNNIAKPSDLSYAGTNAGFPATNNANGILWLGTHSGPHGWQIGFSSNSRIYARYINNNTFPTTANGGSWNKIAWTSDIPTVTNYWWANVKISNASNTDTLPTFSSTTIKTRLSISSSTLTKTNPTHLQLVINGPNLDSSVTPGLADYPGIGFHMPNRGWGSLIYNGNITAINLSYDGYINYFGEGFKKNGSDNTYVLLGGGGHKLISNFATASHTHKYAGSDSSGGAAYSANKLNSRGNLTAYAEGSTTMGESGVNLYTIGLNGYPVMYGNLLHIYGKGAGQLLAEWCGNSNLGHLYYRSKRDNSDNGWTAWSKVAFVTDNVATASKWATARTLTLTGSVTGSVSFDGSGNISLATTTNHTHNWANIENKPSTFTPSSHTHTISDITNLQATLDGKAAASHTHNYLSLSGGTMTGLIIGNNKGGYWILGRSNAAIYQSRNTTGDWHPVVGFKTKTGSWEFGNVGDDDFATFSWGSDSNYSSGTNTTTIVHLRNTGGTIALTSEIPTKSSWNYDDVYSKLGHTHDDRYYTESEINSKLGAYLPLSGGTMTGNITYTGKGTSYIGNGENDAANKVGGALNNLVIASWYGVSFTTSCAGQTYTNKNAVSINCRNGYVYANTFIGSFSGNASSATKLTTSAGNATLPIYFSDGKPVACNKASIFSNLSNNGNDISITIAGLTRTLTVGYASEADWASEAYSAEEANLAASAGYADSAGSATTASKWTTARTLTIGNTSKVVDGSTNVSWTLEEIGVTTSEHTHTLSLTTDTGTSSITLVHGGKYKLTAGGSSVIFTLPTNTTSITFSGGHISSSDNTLTQADHSITIDGQTETAGYSTCNIINSLSVNTLSSTATTNLSAKITVNGITSALKTITQLHSRFWDVTRNSTTSNISPGNYSATITEVQGNASGITGDLPTDSWYHVYTAVGSDTNYATLLALGMTTDGIWYRKYSNSSWGSWLTVLHSGNIENYYWANISISTTQNTNTTPRFGKVKINTDSSLYQLNVNGESYTTGWSRSKNGFYCENNGVYFTHNDTKGEISVKNDNEFCWGANSNILYFNYTAPSLGTTVTLYVWNAGSSSSYASHTMGNITATSINASDNIYAAHFYENSDIRYKRILKNLLINSNTIANLPLFDFEWIENNAIGTGTSALAVQQILPNLVSGTDKLTLDYGVLGTIAGITACKELVTLKSELLQLKEKVKLLEDRLRKYENI